MRRNNVEKLDATRPLWSDPILSPGNTPDIYMRETRAKVNEIIDFLNNKQEESK